MPMDYDEDSGDIALASSSTPQWHRQPSATRQGERLLGKSLWDRPTEVNLNDDAPTPGPSSWDPPAATRRTSSSSSLNRSRSLNTPLSLIDTDTASRGPASATTRTPSMRPGWSRRPGEPRPPPLVNDSVGKRMSRWVKEIVVCNFDLERGPVVERRAWGRRWGPGEKENVAFSSFPDTSLFTEGSILFSFKIRHIPPEPSSLAQQEPPSPLPNVSLQAQLDSTPPPAAGSKAEEYRKWNERGREWLYGFVWFEQRRDKEIARGYMQKSLVILTHLPFPSLWAAVLQKIAPPFFEHGYPALETTCHSIASWPDPLPDSTLELPLMTDVLTVKLPDSTEAPQQPAVNQPILASLPDSSPLRAFATFLPSLWSLWECLILAEPILVIAPDPKTCSEIVWWLRELLRPIPPAGDFRPYLHIHDHDFSLLVNANKPQAGVVVGVTNPFFRNAASHWPNVISIPSTRSQDPNPREGFISQRHRSVQKDRVLLKRLEGLVAEGNFDDQSANEALRAHFQQLTEKMLVPLNRYFQTLVPLPFDAQPIKPFSLPSFLAHLRTHGPNPLAFKAKRLSTKARVENDFYASYCMSATFAGWLAGRVDSLGLAVAKNTTRIIASPVPSNVPSESDATRPSSEDDTNSTARWRLSEDSRGSPRDEAENMLGESYFGRRASEGAVKLLGAMRESSRRV
ncbi:hypothetical protein BCR39DRAFT_519739 [Naematelia encephala]|uniref:UDENN domain-containing protein n=1 Tax=Naematelia encephala TaxID=71784 RepID=A0A1Y2BEY5_9TREE|nr:hypothetical protein BCR39DRAFT_519739 [Naematelia encephala]